MPDINRYLDAAILKPEFTESDLIEAIKACIQLKTYSVCVRPCDITIAQQLCQETETAVCVVLGFPHGVQLPASKADEARRYIERGVDEIDMVANYGWIRSEKWKDVEADIVTVAQLTRSAGVPLKVIFETAHLSSEAIKRMVEVCVRAGADFVKTSTGFNGEGAKVEDVQIMLESAAGRIKVKPSGGIRDQSDALNFIKMGAHRLGVGWTSCQTICEGTKAQSKSGY
ncbi:deoxyribose-phosphate aldolase [Coraliomargarita sp. SDUM461004]|uniref:Deoxyribose-phosphate aldolase n=1 Tax=Thalassobacterium sedimentorum TaxID=3041258 RepID=A0ABU1AGZ7_9BACT|nr:deoxyribose-phosphate aldolase [Coraliomargarita sp. SDUM461004]MDQ8193879.1 deoxyribose-phosphate aldolase [Coraliomargarita sp. SDUM461004]